MGFNQSSRGKAIADINVTPLVDVMLVLLVIFMVTAPMMLNGINLKLPKTSKVSPLSMRAEQVILSVSATGDYYLGKSKILPEEMVGEIKALFKKNKSDILYIRVDESLRYGKVAKLMSSLKKNGVHNLALVTEVEKK